MGPKAAPVFHAAIGQTVLSRLELVVSTMNDAAILVPGVAITVDLSPTQNVTKLPAKTCCHFLRFDQLNGFWALFSHAIDASSRGADRELFRGGDSL